MTYWDKKLLREQLDEKLEKLKFFASPDLPQRGWIRLMRNALGMTAQQLGKRVGLDRSRIGKLEIAEAEGDLKLSSMQKIAEGLNMKFVYGFVPATSLENMVREQARKLALQRMQQVNHTMRLEDQELSEEQKKKALEDLIQKILIEQPKDIWEI
ncbi:MAG: mobile mystery protein A [Phycisphaerales bacterium]|nr:mobile mystery protein A [Phycisphaerales bacterium]